MIFGCVRSGVAGLWANKRMLLPFYLANLFFGLLVMIPFAYALDDFIGMSMMREKLGGGMDYDFLFEFPHYAGNGLSSVTGMVTLVPFAYWLAALFLSGGALAVFAGGARYTPSLFWSGAAAYFGRFVRLAIMVLPIMIALFCLRYLASLFQWVFFGSDPYEYVTYWGAWIKMGLGYIGLILGGLFFDYARIHMVLTDARKARLSLRHGIRFAAGRPAKTLGLALLIFASGWLTLFAYYVVSGLLAVPSWVVLMVLVIVQQIYIVWRMALRLTAYSSQMMLYRRLNS